MQNNDKIICNNIWKLFGPNEKSILSNLDQRLSRNISTAFLFVGDRGSIMAPCAGVV